MDIVKNDKSTLSDDKKFLVSDSMRSLIIAEKPSVAANIASALGATKMDGFFEGSGYYVSYAFGHLFTLADTKDYRPDMEKWDLKDYPFVPQEFQYKPLNDPGVRKQIKILKELAERSDRIINACDGDREGELIFAEIKDFLKFPSSKQVLRLWVTSHTPKDIEKGMQNLRSDTLSLEKAGYCRQQIDWIIGINLTVVYTLMASGSPGGQVLKTGRVILPTLNLIFERETAIANFKVTPFYSLKCDFKAGSESYVGTYIDKEMNTRFDNRNQLLVVQQSIQGKSGTVIKKESNQASVNAPRLFNLTDLQGHITNKYKGFTSDKVLEVIQGLYEKKHVTYPRTSSRFLDNTQVKDAEESLNAVVGIPGLPLKDKSYIRFHTDKKVFDSTRVDSHPAIIPTYIVPSIQNLTEQERIVYIEIVKRFISQFMPAAIYDTVEMVTKIGEHEFITRGRVLISDGWKQLYQEEMETEVEGEGSDQEQEDSITAKNVKEGDMVALGVSELKEGKTKPPSYYTEKTLLAAMENCGKQVENEEDVLKGFTIGTPATRAETIKKLIETGYVVMKGKYLRITEMGAKVIHYFPVKRLLKVEFTGKIEKTLKDIENGQYDSKEFMEKMISFIVKNIEEMKCSKIGTIRKPQNVIGKCPECGRNVIETEKTFTCEASKNGECKFALWKDNKFFSHFGKKLTSSIASDLLNKGKAKVKGLKSSKGNNKFDANILLEKAETGYWNFKLEFSNDLKKKYMKNN